MAIFNTAGFSPEYDAGGISYEDDGASVGTFGGVIGRLANNFSGTTATNMFNAQQAALARQHASDEAQKAREHELYMSNTAYQRAAADMKAAGINPATLSGLAGGGSAASTGSASSSGSASASSSGKSGSIIGSLLKMVGMLAVLAS